MFISIYSSLLVFTRVVRFLQTQIDQANILSATQIANQLVGAVVDLAGNQLGTNNNSDDTFPLADLLSLEPFVGRFKNLNIDNLPKLDAAESALATLKGIKALTEICAEDSDCQNKIVDFGVLCLLKRFLLQDDYEQLAAIEAYDASRAMETQERISSVPGEASVSDINDPSSVRVPRTAHIRRHAARLLMILSVLPKVKKAIVADETWCKWLEECANGSIPGCHDFKMQSYARATLLNIFCTDQADVNAGNDKFPDASIMNKNCICPRYDDRIFLINPELPHWNCYKKVESNTVQSMPTEEPKSNDKSSSDDDSIDGDGRPSITGSNNSSLSTSTRGSDYSLLESPTLDVVFVHGLRGGPFKTWRITEDKSSTQSGLVEKIDQEAGKQGTFWPREWLAAEFPHARLFTLKYKVYFLLYGF